MRIYRILFLVLVSIFLVGCGSLTTLLGFDDPTAIVRDKYDAMSRKDQNAYIATLVPESRNQIATANIVAGGLMAAFIKFDPLEMNFGGWMDQIAGMDMVYRDMQYDVVEQQDDYALVKASGTLSMGNIANFRYCTYQDVRKVNGEWFNDELSPKKEERLKPLMEKHMQRLQEISQSSGVDPLFGSADIALLLNPQLWDVLFDVC